VILRRIGSHLHPPGLPALAVPEPDADHLCEVGWFERRTVNDTDDVAYFWTREAEGALDMQALQRADPADLN